MNHFAIVAIKTAMVNLIAAVLKRLHKSISFANVVALKKAFGSNILEIKMNSPLLLIHDMNLYISNTRFFTE